LTSGSARRTPASASPRKEQNQIYIPAGFAHGFLALTETVQFLYKCSDYYAPSDEYGILCNDPVLAIDWGAFSPVLSEKDANNRKLADVQQQFLPQYSPK
jgi:dTDP-4-dehydrorhamnose 3,5-epimerase